MSELSDLFAAERARRDVEGAPDPAIRERFAFASSLLALRRASGWSQRELAEASGVAQAEISKIERALTVPTISRAERLLKPLGYRLIVAALDATEPERELVGV